MSYSWRNSQLSPFLHNPRSQCLHTTVRSPLMCRYGQLIPLEHVPLRWKTQTAAPDLSMPGNGSGSAPTCSSSAISTSNTISSTDATRSSIFAVAVDVLSEWSWSKNWSRKNVSKKEPEMRNRRQNKMMPIPRNGGNVSSM